MHILIQTNKDTFLDQIKMRKIDLMNSQCYLQGTTLKLDNGMYISLQIKSNPPTATISNLQTNTTRSSMCCATLEPRLIESI